MNPLVIFIFLLGACCGYWLARIQLRGRFELAREAIEDAETPGLESWCRPEDSPLYRDRPYFNLKRPAHPDIPPIMPGNRVRKRFPGTMIEGFSAKQVLGYQGDKGWKPPQYPGGLEEWNRDHGFPVATDDGLD